MKFRNTNSFKLSFALDKLHFEVEPGAECDVPDHIAYAIKLQGIQLAPLAMAEANVAAAGAAEEERESPSAPVPPPSPAQTKHWKRR